MSIIEDPMNSALDLARHMDLSHIVLQMPSVSMINGDDKGFDRNKFIKHYIACAALSDAISSGAFPGNTFSNKIDFKNDLISFVDFMEGHKNFIEQIVRFRDNMVSTGEIRIFRKIYDALKNVSGCIEGIIEEDYD